MMLIYSSFCTFLLVNLAFCSIDLLQLRRMVIWWFFSHFLVFIALVGGSFLILSIRPIKIQLREFMSFQICVDYRKKHRKWA